MIPLLKRVEIQVLSRAGHSEPEIARLTGVSLRSIRRIQREGRVESIDDAAERQRRRIGRPSEAARFQELVVRELRQNFHCSSAEILRRARDQQYTGSKTAMYGLISRLRSSIGNPLMTLDGLPGALSKHEFGEMNIPFSNRTRTRVYFLASWLEFSRWTVVSLLPDDGLESLLRGLVDHFVRFEGVPAVAVLGGSNSVLNTSELDLAYESQFVAADAVVDLGICVQWPRSRKGATTLGPADRVKRSFFQPGRFANWQNMCDQLATWQVEVNTNISFRNTSITPAARIREDRAHLRAITTSPADFALRIPVAIGTTAEVVYDGVTYRLPAEMTDRMATLHLYCDRLVVVAGDRVVEHERRPSWPGMSGNRPDDAWAGR
jgi:transposase